MIGSLEVVNEESAQQTDRYQRFSKRRHREFLSTILVNSLGSFSFFSTVAQDKY